jgi:DNA-binding LytR/AlgR family response regulator
MIRALIVDDVDLAREAIRVRLQEHEDVEIVGEASSGLQAASAIRTLNPDLVFLDVRMPGLDGLELGRILRRFERPPAVVFVSAFDSFAVDAFELAALDYLVKPVARRRLAEAVERVARAAAPDSDVVPVDNLRGGGTRLLSRGSILFLQAHGDYVRVAADEGRFLLRARLADLEERWARHGFVRVHRGYVVNLPRAVEVRPQPNGTAVVVMADGAEVPIARRHLADLRRRLGV